MSDAAIRMDSRRVLIDAAAQFDGRPLALEAVYYPTLIGAYARAVRGAASLIVAVSEAHREELRRRLAEESVDDAVELVDALPVRAAGDIAFDLREVHLPPVLASAVRVGAVLEKPVWLLREPADLGRAAATLERHDMYIMARHLVIPVAKRLAHRLLPTRISPNTVTAASCLCGVFAAAVPLLADTWTGRILSALLVHLSITLDFTDGYLARLRGTDSTVGYWFDTTMDEVVKFSLFLGMTLLVMLDGVRWGFGAGIVTLLLYHVLTSSHWITVSLENGASGGAAARAVPRWRSGWIGMVKRVYERLNYLDVHLYVIALALLLRLEAVVLAMFAVIYTFRFFRMLQLRLFTRTLS